MSRVIETLECPSLWLTTCTGAPEASNTVALVCRSPWKTRRASPVAVEEGITLKAWVERAIAHELGRTDRDRKRHR
jgi:hypothetical protein